MRLDKFLSQLNMGTRSEVKQLIRKGQVTVNGIPATSPEQKIDEQADTVVCQGKMFRYQKYVYYMMNKPQGVISATMDPSDQTVLDLLRPYLPEQDGKRELVPAGRLDKDTEGLLLLTDDGSLIHELLSPKKHVDKTYLVETAKPLSAEALCRLEEGVDIGEARQTLPAKAKLISERCLQLTIHEGKFHQVKRMLRAVGNEVTALKRISFGTLQLDETLAPGECRPLTEVELQELYALTASEKENDLSAQVPAIPDLEGIEAVIFDLDGTLVDSMWMWHQIDIEYLGRYGIPLPERLQESIEGKSFHETAVYFKERFDIPESLDEIKDTWNAMAWDKYEREVPLKPGVKAFLETCRRRGIKLGIATSNSRALAQNIADVHGLHDYFGCIMTGCDVLKGKPAPDIYLAAAKGLGADPAHCLVFEDIIPGIMAGKSAGMKVCAVEDAYSADVRAQKQELADYYIVDYTNLQEIEKREQLA
ncbi:MAG: pseudouridine synthase [Acetatifactor sp.]|nr:pseudouridine synthase [Acetatifactor sp.]